MADRRQGKFPPRTDGGPERRAYMRREVDCENQEIAKGAVEVVPFVKRFKNSLEVAVISAIIGAMIAAPASLFGSRVVGPRQDIAAVNLRVDTNAARINALQRDRDDLSREVAGLRLELRDMKNDMSTLTSLACVTARRNSPDVADVVPGCKSR